MSDSDVGSQLISDGLTDDLTELGRLLEDLPTDARRRAASLYSRLLDSNQKRRELMELVRGAINDMRFDLKCLEFDLEATRRERDAYRQMLEAEGEFDGFDEDLETDIG